jgi:hypothetical protein
MNSQMMSGHAAAVSVLVVFDYGRRNAEDSAYLRATLGALSRQTRVADELCSLREGHSIGEQKR